MFGVFIGLLCYLIQFNFNQISIPGFKLFNAPAIFALSFFSEETNFVPKMIIISFGQFTGYFCLAFAYHIAQKLGWNSPN